MVYPLLQIGSTIYIPTFFIAVSAATIAALNLFAKLVAEKNLNYEFHLNLSFLLMFSGLVGGRLTHVLIEQPGYYANDPLKILYLWEGGYVFFGGFILSTIVGLTYYRFKIKNWNHLGQTLDALAAPTALGYSIGRIGCFLSGCCYGQLSTVFWAVAGRHPTQIYASAWELGNFLILIGIQKKQKSLIDGQVFWIWLGLHSTGRFWIELLRDDFRGPTAFFSISGWISIILLIVSVMGLCLKVFQPRQA